MAASAASASPRASQRSTGRRPPWASRGAVAPIRTPLASSTSSPGSPPGKAWPSSKSARSPKPRAWLRAAARRRPGQQVGAQVAHLGADRVLQPHRLAAAAEELGRGAVDEAVGDALVEAERGDARGAPGASRRCIGVSTGRATPGARVIGRPSSRLERGDAGDLLDEVRLALHVGPPRRDRDLERRRPRRPRAKPSAVEDAHLLVRRRSRCRRGSPPAPAAAGSCARCRAPRRRSPARRPRRRRDRGSCAVASSMPTGVKAGSTPRSKR